MKKLSVIFILLFPILLKASEELTTPAVVNEPNKFALWFGITVTVLLGISEALAVIPFIKANSIYQLLLNILKALAGKK
jgi:hypothetical protein